MKPDDLAPPVPIASWRLPEADDDPQETREWLDALDAVIEQSSPQRATFLLQKLVSHARRRRVQLAHGGQHAVRQHDRPGRAAALTRATWRSSRG